VKTSTGQKFMVLIYIDGKDFAVFALIAINRWFCQIKFEKA